MKKNLRILCISPAFVPLADSEAFCGAKMLTAMHNIGLHVSILAIGSDYWWSDRTLDESKMWKDIRDQSTEVGYALNANRLYRIITICKYKTLSWARWVREVVNTAEKMNGVRKYDIVYSRSLPMFAHIAGYWCSKKLSIPWISNINDPWDFHLFPDTKKKYAYFYARNSEYWLRKTIKCASIVTYPCERLWKYHEKISALKHNCRIIPHVGYKTEPRPNADLFYLVHAGKIGSTELGGRPTNSLLEGMVRFFDSTPYARERTKLVLVGPKDDDTDKIVKTLGIEKNVESVGRVYYEDSLQYIAQASVCILVEGDLKEGIYLPTKLTDYLAAKKPLLALSPAVGTVNDMLPNKGIIRVNQGDVNGVANALAIYFKHYCNGTLSENAPSDALVRQFTVDTVVNSFLSAVNDAIG